MTEAPESLERELARIYLQLPDERKKRFIRFVLINKPKGIKLRELLRDLIDSEPSPGYDIKFSLDLLGNGVGGEEELKRRLEKVEVKTDIRVSDTHNLVVEKEYKGHPSGIAVTEAQDWFFWLDGPEFKREVGILIATERIDKVRKAYGEEVIGGDNNSALMDKIDCRSLLTKISHLEQRLNKERRNNLVKPARFKWNGCRYVPVEEKRVPSET